MVEFYWEVRILLRKIADSAGKFHASSMHENTKRIFLHFQRKRAQHAALLMRVASATPYWLCVPYLWNNVSNSLMELFRPSSIRGTLFKATYGGCLQKFHARKYYHFSTFLGKSFRWRIGGGLCRRWAPPSFSRYSMGVAWRRSAGKPPTVEHTHAHSRAEQKSETKREPPVDSRVVAKNLKALLIVCTTQNMCIPTQGKHLKSTILDAYYL